MSFQISGLPSSDFQLLVTKSEEELAHHGAMRMVADQKPGFPCRVSLADAEVGEEVILIHYEHQKTNSPFRASHAIFIRPGAPEPKLSANEVPVLLRSRVLSLRGFDEAGMLIGAELTDGTAVKSAIETMFGDPAVAYIHIHFAKAGCYAARADRTPDALKCNLNG